MKAMVCTKYGPPEVLQLQEVETPVPGDREVLVKVRATTANAADARIRGSDLPPLVWLPMRAFLGFTGPRCKILGVELAGDIVTVGKDVTRFKEGDAVFGSTGARFRANAQYCSLREDAIMTEKPSNMSYEEAAAVPHCALCALHYLRKGNVHHGQKVLIYGASGGIGTFAVQLAKAFGAEVTGVCSTANLELVKSLGADKVIDYTEQSITQGGELYDAIFDTIGKSSHGDCISVLKDGGVYLNAVHLDLGPIFQGLWTNITTGKKVVGGVASYPLENLVFLKELIEAGKLKSVLDKTYSLKEMVEAHKHVDTGHKKGNVAITVEHDGD